MSFLRARTIALAILIALVGALAAFVISSRPALDRNRDAADAAWVQLGPPLTARYQTLRDAGVAARTALGEDRSPLQAVARDTERWNALRIQGGSADQVLLANQLEGDAARLRALVTATARLRDAPPVQSALQAFAASEVGAAGTRYDDAVRTYEHGRRGLVRRLAASLLGYGARPLYEPAASAAA